MQLVENSSLGVATRLWIEDADWHLFHERGDRAVWLARSGDRKV